MQSRFVRFIVASSVLVFTACGGKKTPTQPVPTASIAVSSAVPTLTVAQRTAGTAAITVGRTSFSGDVALTAENLPTGVTATFTPATVSAGATSSSLSLTASGTAVAGGPATTVTLRARGTGVADAITTLALTITAGPAGAVSIALSPSSDSVVAGSTVNTVVAITRSGGFTGGVNMTISGVPPSGVTTTFTPANPVTGNSVNLSIATLASLTPGTYALQVRANSASLTEALATYTLKIAAPPSNSVTWRFCNANRLPLWFAYQDGLTGSWQRVTETTPGVYTFAYGQPQVGVAAVTSSQGQITTEIKYFGLSEITAAAAAECTENPVAGTKSLSGSVSGFGAATEIATVSLGNALSSATNQSTPAFTITNVANGPLDLIAVRANLVTSSALRVLMSRGVNVANGASLGTLDLAAGTSFAPASGTVTVTAPNDGPILAQNIFMTANGSGASFSTAQLSTGVQGTYQGIPDATLLATDVQRFQATQQVGTTLSRFITRYTRGPTTVTLAMPSDPGAPTLTNIAGAPQPRATVAGALPTAFNNLITFAFTQSARSRTWNLSATPAGRGGTITSYALSLPDFSGVAGWQSTWALGTGATDVTSTFFGSSGTALNGTPITGSLFFTFGRLGSFTFP